MTSFPRLYAVADATFGNPVPLAKALFAGGALLVQVRHKDASARQLLSETEEILKLSPPAGRVLVNDRADVARIAGAAGVHLGQHDLLPRFARNVLSAGQLIGYSTHSLDQAMDADKAPVDYIAVGPVFSTTTKANPDPPLGLERLCEICLRVTKPVVAIGGISLQSVHEVLRCGVASVAVISDLLNNGDVAERTREWVRAVERQ